MSTDDPLANGDTTAETDKEIIGPNVPPGTKVTVESFNYNYMVFTIEYCAFLTGFIYSLKFEQFKI